MLIPDDVAPDLRHKVRRLLDGLYPEAKRETSKDLETVFRAGVRTVSDLYALLRDGRREKLRRAACWMVAEFDDDRRRAASGVADLLGANVSTDTRVAAVVALAGIGGMQARMSLEGALRGDPDPVVRARAAHGIGILDDAEENGVSTLVEALRNKAEDADVRAHAAEALAHRWDPRALPALREALSDEVAQVRFWAAYTLGQRGSADVIDDLKRLVESDEAEIPEWGKVRNEARDAITRILTRLENKS